MPGRYDLVVIGAGAAGLVASVTAAGLGARVALVEADRPGGDCLYKGCVPSKSLIASAGLAHAIRTSDRLGLEASEPEVDFATVMRRVGGVIEAAGEPDTPERLERLGIELVADHGRFERPGVIRAGARELSYRAAVIATGSRPLLAPLEGLAAAEPLTTETVFDLRDLPRRLVVLGGGPVGVELGQAFARLGSAVEIVERAQRLLPGEEPESSELVARALAAEGVGVWTAAHVAELRPAGAGAGTLVLDDRPSPTELRFDRLLVATGRTPRADDTALERVGVETTGPGWIRVDDRLRTSGDRILAAGDALGEPFFTHVAGHQGAAAALNALFRARRKVALETVPSVTFTDPEVARVGLTEVAARARLAADPVVLRHDHARSDRALTVARTDGFTKLVTDRRGHLVGATIVGPSAGESIAAIAPLVRERAAATRLAATMFAYPTFSEAPGRAAGEWWQRRAPRARIATRPLLAALRALDRPRPARRR